MGAVLVRGAKWCGKTTTCEQLAKSVLYMADPDHAAMNRETARIRPSLLLKGATPRLIDEWQEAPELWDAIRFSVDHREGYGQYILTGSAVPPEADEENESECVIRHTGAGRIARFTMRPMSLYESGDSTGEVSLEELFSGKNPTGAANRLKLEDLAELVCRGGWPAALGMPRRYARKPVEEYLAAIVESDVTRVDKSLRDPERVRRRGLRRRRSRWWSSEKGTSPTREPTESSSARSALCDHEMPYAKGLRHHSGP